jgi:hypothetical protein
MGDLLRVLAAIDLHDERGRHAQEVHDVRSDRNLAAELGAPESAIAQVIPQAVLRFRLARA